MPEISEEQKQQDQRLAEKMAQVKNKIFILSGKGGVGKSTVAVNLAYALALEGSQVGLMDVDVHGPNIAKMLGIEDKTLTGSQQAMEPVEVIPGLKAVSLALAGNDADTPFIWRGPLKTGLIRQFLADVEWGPLDYLIVDTPPGTGDEPLSAIQNVPEPTGGVIVTTPQDVALLDSRKSVNFARKLDLPVLGIVENMSGFACPHCGKEIPIFGKGGGEKAAQEMGVPFLGALPLDPAVVVSGDQGRPFSNGDGEPSPVTEAARGVIARMREIIRGCAGAGRADPPQGPAPRYGGAGLHRWGRGHPLDFSAFTPHSDSVLRVRYTTNEAGKAVKQAAVYSQEEHGIPQRFIDSDALWIAKRLKKAGHECYVVGGAVRDLLLGRQPKDFDLATDARPRRIKKLFRNAWIIGRRFRLVHIRFNEGKIIELATFRSDKVPQGKNNNEFGTLAQDVRRRDFSLNALYYDPVNGELIDFVGGLEDVKKHRIRPVVPLDYTFDEDPVRMLRGVKYGVTTESKIPRNVRKAILASSEKLRGCSASRLSEELFKILQSGESRDIVEALSQYTLLAPLLPEIGLHVQNSKALRGQLLQELAELDERKAEGKAPGRGEMLAALVKPFFKEERFFEREDRPPFTEAALRIKGYIQPLTAPNKDVDDAVRILYREAGFNPGKRRSRKKPPRRRPAGQKNPRHAPQHTGAGHRKGG